MLIVNEIVVQSSKDFEIVSLTFSNLSFQGIFVQSLAPIGKII